MHFRWLYHMINLPLPSRERERRKWLRLQQQELEVSSADFLLSKEEQQVTEDLPPLISQLPSDGRTGRRTWPGTPASLPSPPARRWATSSPSLPTSPPTFRSTNLPGQASPSLPLPYSQLIPRHVSLQCNHFITTQVSFDEYIHDRPRVFRAMFPDKRRRKRLNDEEWQIQMLPIQFLFATVNPIVVMRLRHKSNGKEYPPDVPQHATSFLELQATRWELRGFEDIQMPPHFALSVQGVLYPDRSSSCRRLKGHLEMGISMILPPVLKLVPEDVLRGIADAVLRRLLEKMKQEVDVGLISDYANFRREQLMVHGAATQASAASSKLKGSS